MRCTLCDFRGFGEKVLLLCLCTLMSAMPVAAATTQPYTVSPVVGIFMPGSLSDQGNAALVGVKLGTPVTDRFSFGGGVGLLSLKGGGNLLIDLQMLYPLKGWRELSPFLSFGVGGVLASSGHSGPLVSFGVGGRYFLSPKFALRGEVRDVASTGMGNSLEFSMGLSYFFGGKEIPKVRRRQPLSVASKAQSVPVAPVTVAAAQSPPSDASVSAQPRAKDESITPVAVDVQPSIAVNEAKEADLPIPQADPVALTTPEATVTAAPTLVDAVADAPPPVSLEENVDVASMVMQVVIEFNSGRAQIRASNIPVLSRAGLHLKHNPNSSVKIVGHADSTGVETDNYRLALKRAEKAKQYLINMYQISPERIHTEGKGDSQPVADSSTSEGRQKNRRAVITIFKAAANVH